MEFSEGRQNRRSFCLKFISSLFFDQFVSRHFSVGWEFVVSVLLEWLDSLKATKVLATTTFEKFFNNLLVFSNSTKQTRPLICILSSVDSNPEQQMP